MNFGLSMGVGGGKVGYIIKLIFLMTFVLSWNISLWFNITDRRKLIGEAHYRVWYDLKQTWSISAWQTLWQPEMTTADWKLIVSVLDGEHFKFNILRQVNMHSGKYCSICTRHRPLHLTHYFLWLPEMTITWYTVTDRVTRAALSSSWETDHVAHIGSTKFYVGYKRDPINKHKYSNFIFSLFTITNRLMRI